MVPWARPLQLAVGMRGNWLLGFTTVLVLGGCSAGGDPNDKAPGDWVPGKGDGAFELVEAGPAPIGGSTTLALDGRVPAFRVESFGNTELTIDVKADDGYVIVEGPLDGNGDRVAVGGGSVVAEDDDSGDGYDASVTVKLERAGVYRILAGTFESLGVGERATGEVELAVACNANCTRGSIDQKTFVRALQAQSGGAFSEMLKGELAALVHDPAAATALGARLDAILADPDLEGIERFPTFSLTQIATLRPALGGLNAEAPAPDQVITGDLQQILGGCTPDRSLPADLDARLPGVKYGHFPDATLAPCQFAHADKLAQVLTSLAADNGSSVTFKGETINSPKALFAALLASGHSVEVRNERTYANFLSAIVGDKDLVWPVWLDTGITLSNGETFVIPMGHSHHAWRISGPNVNTRVMFYLGISGTAFWGQTGTRPAWTGEIVSAATTVSGTTGADAEYLLSTLDAATTYLQRNRVERTTVAAGMPADGYGYVGVCNDSNATLELATKGTISAFPLLRAKELDAEADLGDGLDATVKALPNDADGITDRADALRRAVAMQPHPNGSPLILDAKLAAQIAAARAEVR